MNAQDALDQLEGAMNLCDGIRKEDREALAVLRAVCEDYESARPLSRQECVDKFREDYRKANDLIDKEKP